MINKLKPYSIMKDSGAPWLGSVPGHWDVFPNRVLFKEIIDRGHPEEQMLSVTIKTGVIRQKALLADSSKKDTSNLDKSAYKFVQPGDIVYNKMRAWQGAFGVSDYKGIVSPAYVVQRPHKGIHSQYFHYLMRTPAFAKEAERWSYGITSDMWSLRSEHFKMIYSCLPPLSEQIYITRYLSNMDKLIRSFIRKKKKMIDLLEEQKRAIVHYAVTRGIDQNVPLTHSGVIWLGEIPKHWGIRKLNQCCTISGGMTPSMDIHRFWDGNIPWVTPKDMKRSDIGHSLVRITEAALQETSIRLIEPPAVLLVVRGMILAKRVPVAWITAPVTINQDMKALKTINGVNAEFLTHMLDSAQEAFAPLIDESGHGTRRLPMERWKDLAVAIPPEEEQITIVNYIDDAIKKSIEAIARTEQEITLLREYHTRLIADVVTGKLDVREVAAKLPDEITEPGLEEDSASPYSTEEDEVVEEVEG